MSTTWTGPAAPADDPDPETELRETQLAACDAIIAAGEHLQHMRKLGRADAADLERALGMVATTAIEWMAVEETAEAVAEAAVRVRDAGQRIIDVDGHL